MALPVLWGRERSDFLHAALSNITSKKLADASRGFLYAVTVTGITGGSGGAPAELSAYLDKISAVAKVPVCAGFGIREAADVAAVGQHAAGAIVGSALVEILERNEDPTAFLKSLTRDG